MNHSQHANTPAKTEGRIADRVRDATFDNGVRGLNLAQLFATYSDSKSPSRTGVECMPACFLPDSFVVFDAVAWWKINDALTTRAGVFNVADEKYWGWGDVRGVSSTTTFIDAFGQPGRSASVSLAMQFQPLHADRGRNDPDQHSGMFTAKPPREVSL